MASKREIELIIKAIDQSASVLAKLQTNLAAINKQIQGLNSQTIKVESQGAEKAAKSLGQAADAAKRLGTEAEGAQKKGGQSFLLLAAAVGGITQAFQIAIGISKRFYNETIGANEKLQQQIIASAATISSSNRVTANGIDIVDPTERIKALREPIREGINDLEIATRDLVGVTSQQVNDVFSILLTNSGQLANQSDQFKDSIGASVELSRGFVATLGTLQIPLDQARQEINSIITGQITSDSILAKSVGITSKQVRDWKAQGVLVDELNKKLEPFVAGNALAAQSIGGVSSNILDIIQVLARQASEPLLSPIIDSLNQVYEFANANQDVFTELGQNVSTAIITIAEVLARVIEPLKSFSSEGSNLKAIFGGIVNVIVDVTKALEPLATGIIILIKANIEGIILGLKLLAPILKVIGEFALKQLKATGEGLKSVAIFIQEGLSSALLTVKGRLQSIIEFIRPLGELITTTGRPFFALAKTIISSFELIPPIFNAVKNGIIESLGGTPLGIAVQFFGTLKEGAVAVSQAVGGVLLEGFKQIPTAITSINNFLAPIIDNLVALIGRAETVINNAKAALGVRIDIDSPDGSPEGGPADGIKAATDATVSAIKTVVGAAQEEVDNIDIGQKIAEDLGTIPDQLKEKLAQAQTVLSQGIGGEDASQQVKTIIEANQQLIDQGLISREEAAATLQSVATNEKLLVEDRLNAATQLRKIQADSSNSRIEDIKAEIAAVEAQQSAEGDITVESIRKINALRQQELQARLDSTAKAIETERALIASGSGSQKELDKLIRDQKQLATEGVRLAVESERQIRSARIAEIEKTASELQRIQIEAQRNVFRAELELKERRATDATFTEEKLQAELSAIQLQAERDRTAQDIELQQQRIAVYKEGTKERIDAENQLFQLQLDQEKQAEQAKEIGRKAAKAEINARIEGAQELQKFEEKRLELLRAAEDLILKSLDRQKSLFDSQINLAKSAQDIQIQAAQGESKRLRESLKLRREINTIEQELKNEELSPEQRKALNLRLQMAQKELEILGLKGKSEQELEKNLFKSEKERIEREREQVEFQQSVAVANLEFEIQRDILSAKRAVREEEGRKRELEFQRTLLQLEAESARAGGDERAAQIAETGIAQLDEGIAQQGQAIAEAQQGVRDTELLGQQRREALEIQQASEDISANAKAADESLTLFREAGAATQNIAADFAKESQKVLEKSLSAGEKLAQESLANVNRLTEILFANLNQAAARIGSASGTPVSRDTGGPINANQLYNMHAGEIVVPGASSKPHAMRLAGGGMFLDSNQLFRPNKSGYVLNRGDVNLLGLSAGLMPTQGNQTPVIDYGFNDSRLLGAMGQGNVFLRQLVEMSQNQNQTHRKIQANERLKRFANGR